MTTDRSAPRGSSRHVPSGSPSSRLTRNMAATSPGVSSRSVRSSMRAPASVSTATIGSRRPQLTPFGTTVRSRGASPRALSARSTGSRGRGLFGTDEKFRPRRSDLGSAGARAGSEGEQPMRPLRYSINITLDGCCDHREGRPDEALHRHHAVNLERADALLFGRVTYEMMEEAWRKPATGTWPDWMPGWMIPFARTIDRGEEVRRVEHARAGSTGTPSSCAATWGHRGRPAQAAAGRRPVRGRRDPPAGPGEPGIDRRVRVRRAPDRGGPAGRRSSQG
ncbi:MAG: hypothetical protein KatS3mg010_0454 [Acidimicrobiia bacterium]|nr:MAG: hypothetical protein KatS3mg010_0454 [Acidimicrobiia bacterium]